MVKAQIDIPADLTSDGKAAIYQLLDAELNSTILSALLYGIYTGILAVALWNIFINKCWAIKRGMVIVIIVLHGLATINLAANWSWICSSFIANGKNFWTVYSNLNDITSATYWVMRIASSTGSTILADSYIIWCCWMVWDRCSRRWLIVLPPICSLVGAIISKTIYEYYGSFKAASILDEFVLLYIGLVLVTTLYCPILIIYRIITAASIRPEGTGRLGVFRRFVEVLVESSALYSIFLILDLVFTAKAADDPRQLYFYFDIIAGITKGVVPTILIGRAAAGHTRPREDSDGSTVSSLHFQTSSAHSATSSRLDESTVQTSVLAMDIEAQPEQQLAEQDTEMPTMSDVV